MNLTSQITYRALGLKTANDEDQWKSDMQKQIVVFSKDLASISYSDIIIAY
jgi:hypothetical protein